MFNEHSTCHYRRLIHYLAATKWPRVAGNISLDEINLSWQDLLFGTMYYRQTRSIITLKDVHGGVHFFLLLPFK